MNDNSLIQKLSLNKQDKWISYIIVFLIMMYNSGNIILMNNYFLLVLAIFLVFYSRLWETIKPLGIILVLAVLTFYFILAFSINDNYPDSYDFTFIVRHLSYVVIAFSVLKKMSFNFFFIFEDIFFYLMIISLILFGIQLFKPDLILSLVSMGEKILGFTHYNPNPDITYHSMLIYTYNRQIGDLIAQRNCGYLYEPGYYSIHIIIALFISLVKSNLTLNKKHIFYIIALITTVSTTGYLGFLCLVVFYVFNLKNHSYRYFALIAALPIIVYVIFLPVVYDKIARTISEANIWVEYARQIIAEGGHYSIGRFAGASIAYNAIKDISPVFGIFRNYDKLVKGFIIVNGFAEQLVSFGFAGLALLLYGLYKSSKIFIENNFDLKYSILFFATLIISNFSYVFNSSIIFWIIYFYFLSEARFKTFRLYQMAANNMTEKLIYE